MSKRLVAFAFVLVVLLFGTSSYAIAGGRPFATPLSGAEEIGGGDPDGSGFASLTFNPGLGEVCFDITTEGIALPVTAAHIHAAPAGVNGPIVVPLLTTPDEDGNFSGCVTADRDLVKTIAKNPTDYYVNVHNGEFPGGAMRGQLGD